MVAAMPGVGKTYLFNRPEYKGLKMTDSDSSKFSWDKNGERSKEFPENYIKHIKSCIQEGYDLILVSSHKIVRDAMLEEGIDFNLVYPSKDQKDEYIKRFIERGSPESFVKLVGDNWNSWIDEIENDDRLEGKRVKLSGEDGNRYLSDILK